MCVTITNKIWLIDMPSSIKIVLVRLGDIARKEGDKIWASKTTIAKQCGLSRKTVQTSIKSLIADKILIEAGHVKCHGGYTVEYAIDLEVLDSLSGDSLGEQIQPVASVQPQEITIPKLQIVEAKPSAPKRKRACQLPANWVANDKNIQDAQNQDFTYEEIENEIEKFRDYWISTGATKVDWDATWRNWLRKSKEFGRNRANSGRGTDGTSTADAFARVSSQLERDERSKARGSDFG